MTRRAIYPAGPSPRSFTYVVLFARLMSGLAYIQIGHGTDVFAAMAGRGADVTLALIAAFLAGAYTRPPVCST